jgi:tRNA-modifying protein YgfZ
VTPSAAAPGAAAGYGRLRAGEPVAARGRAALVWVEGPDAATFLHGLLSHDVAGLAPGGGRLALLLDAKGHVQADMRVRRDDAESFTLVLDPPLADLVAGLLERYHFSEDLELLGPEESDLVTVAGVPADRLPADAPAVEGRIPGTTDLLVDDAAATIAALGVEEIPPEALELARVAAGVLRIGVDTGPSTLVQEARLEESAVSFEKGCYLGQETVARAQYRGRVNKLARGLELPAAVAPGAVVRAGGREAGRLTSVAETPDLGPVGLAILRRDAAPGSEVEVEGAGTARVVELPFPRS